MIEGLKDIKASQTIQIDLLPYFLFSTVFVLCIVAIVLYFILRPKKKLTKKQLAVKHLKTLDFDTLEDKQIAYQFCEYGYQCVEEHFMDEFKKIEHQLETFKYKKDIPKLDHDLKEQITDYIKVRL